MAPSQGGTQGHLVRDPDTASSLEDPQDIGYAPQAGAHWVTDAGVLRVCFQSALTGRTMRDEGSFILCHCL